MRYLCCVCHPVIYSTICSTILLVIVRYSDEYLHILHWGLLGTLCGSPLWGCRFPRPKSWASGGAVKKSFFEILSVATALVVMRTRLVHRTVINSASGKLILSIGIESCTFWDQTPISIQLSSTTFCAIPCTIFPCIWSDNIPPFHEDSLSHRSRDSVKTSILQPGKDPTSGLQQPTSGPSALPILPQEKPTKDFLIYNIIDGVASLPLERGWVYVKAMAAHSKVFRTKHKQAPWRRLKLLLADLQIFVNV